MSQGWKYICLAIPLLIFGQLATGISDSNSITLTQEQTLRVIGASLSAMGGLLIVIGFRAQYRMWNPKGMKSSTTLAEQKMSTPEAVAKPA